MKQKIQSFIIEDEDRVIQPLSKKLKSLGHQYIIARNQEEANTLIEIHSFDYILLDLKLPVDSEDIDPDSSVGFNLLEQIRIKYSKAEIPIIVMTAYEKNINSAVEAMKKGANDFIEKPFKSGELEKKIQTILQVKQSDPKLSLKKNKPSHQKDLEKFPTPEGTRWEDVTIQIVSKDSIKISVKEVHKRFNYAEIGFKDKRKGDLPDSQWEVLKDFGAQNGEISWGSQRAQLKIQKKIQKIRKRLRNLIGIDGDPFYPYRKYKAYKTKFKIEDISYSN